MLSLVIYFNSGVLIIDSRKTLSLCGLFLKIGFQVVHERTFPGQAMDKTNVSVMPEFIFFEN